MKVQHSLLWPCIFALVFSNTALAAHDRRQILPTNTPPPNPSGTPGASNTDTAVPTQTSATQNTPPPVTTGGTTSTTQTTTSTTAVTTSGTTQVDTTSAPPATDTSVSTPPVTPIVSESIGTDGSTVTITSTPSPSATEPAPSNSAAPSDSDDGGGLSTGSIIGMSVAAGVAVIGIVGFFVWKFTRKRFSDFDDNEAIKWPELNAQSGDVPGTHALPARDTGRSGFDTGSEADLSRVNSASNYSTPDFGTTGSDPYAVPPLPHLNPNQPYRDDPSGASGFYDPYRGPVPGTLEHGTGDWQTGEAYPMTQFGHPQARASPAPDYISYDTGRQSPALYGRGSPAPQVAYGGRVSPGPQVAYGGQAPPALHAAYSAGRASPGPNPAYDAYGAR
ncbi:hypothetical protein D9756_003226 [Leucocoprinus leucothites]|uniref:Transmembrane protein n=1 Tax=Leucocoprinus leucothites TaxID=201217 RepID=A0A8H5G7G2_9AGAR|nr:hypothetical protein D9756_003226 [Leucoagaricus leucothites]